MANRWERAHLLALLTPRFLLVAGLLAAISFLYIQLTDVTMISGAFPETTLEFLLLGIPAIGLIYAGYWLEMGNFTPDQIWIIGSYAIGGALIGSISTSAAMLLLPLAPLTTPTAFPLFIATGSEGALIGVLVGAFTVTDVIRRRESSAVEDLALLQSVLRHDIRNRLTIAGGHLSLAIEATGDTVATHRRTVQRQLDAIEDLLEESQIATEAIVGNEALEPVELTDPVREQITLLQDSYDAVEVRAELPDSAVVMADELLPSAIDNLVNNAVIHTDRDNPTITVTIDDRGDWIRLEIADDGPGIPDERKDQVREPGEGDGSGMGLYLVDRLIDRYGGRLTIGDNHPRGTVVTITFPKQSSLLSIDPSDVIS